MNAKEVRSAVITGTGSGLGRDIALGLATKGYLVFGTAMTVGEIADLRRSAATSRGAPVGYEFGQNVLNKQHSALL